MITVFYDGKCSLCAREIAYYQRIAPKTRFIWDDITQVESHFIELGYTRKAGLMKLHALDDDNKLHVGVDAFILIWRQLPKWHLLAKLIKIPIFYPMASIAYNAFAKWRFKRLKHCDI